jgi:hypothetical protein
MTGSRIPAVLAGVAGEYFVAGELSRRGYVASITLRNTRGIDILASNADATRSVGIQVKAKQVARAGWILNKKSEEAPDGELADNLFYVFVSLNGLGAPSYYVVPRSVVATYTGSITQTGSQRRVSGTKRTKTILFATLRMLRVSIGMHGIYWVWITTRSYVL